VARQTKPAPVPPAPRRSRHALLIAALWAATLLAYANSFQAGLVFDSQRVILADARIQAATSQNVGHIWSDDYYNHTGAGALYRPLTTLTYLLNYSVFGDGPNAAGYHWFNFAVHAGNVALVYLLALLIFQETWPAFAVAALWALHPALAESITNVVGRADLLAAFGVLAGLLCYTRFIRPAGSRRALWFLALAASAAIAIFSKESGVALLGVMLLYDVALAPKTSWAVRVVGYLAAFLPVVVYLQMRSHVLAQVSSVVVSFCDNPLLQAGFWTARLTAVKVLGNYFWLLLWPARLSADYSYNQIPLFGWNLATWENAKTVIALLLWIAVAAGAVAAYRRARPLFFFILFFFVTIAPSSNVFVLIGSIMAERFLYLPAIGFAGCLVCAALAVYRHAPAAWRSSRIVMPATLALACTALGDRTYVRNFDWHDERSLWSSAIQASPASYKTHDDMAIVLLSQPQPDVAGATRELEKSLAILDPLPDSESLPSVYATAGFCYRTRGDLPKALAVLSRGRTIDRAWNEAVQQRNRADGKAISAIGTPPLYVELGRVDLAMAQPQKALEALRFGRLIDPEPEFFLEISHADAAMGQQSEAIVSLLEGLVVDPTQGRLVSEATKLYQQNDPQSCALRPTGVGVSLDVNCPLVHTQLCTASGNVFAMYRQMGDPASAGATAQGAVRNFGCPADLFR
jgi:protein O-mannosyl-transferase